MCRVKWKCIFNKVQWKTVFTSCTFFCTLFWRHCHDDAHCLLKPSSPALPSAFLDSALSLWCLHSPNPPQRVYDLYNQVGYNCFIAAAVYVAVGALSCCQMRLNKKKVKPPLCLEAGWRSSSWSEFWPVLLVVFRNIWFSRASTEETLAGGGTSVLITETEEMDDRDSDLWS